MVGKEIVTFLASKSIGTDGDDDGGGIKAGAIFRERLPDTPDVCGVVRLFSARAPRTGLGDAGIRYEYPGIRVQFRGKPDDPDGPQKKCQEAFEALATVQAQTLSGTLYLLVRMTRQPHRLPGKLGYDEQKRHIWTTEAECEKELSV